MENRFGVGGGRVGVLGSIGGREGCGSVGVYPNMAKTTEEPQNNQPASYSTTS